MKKVIEMPDFKGYLSDLGGPSANMYGMSGNNPKACGTILKSLRKRSTRTDRILKDGVFINIPSHGTDGGSTDLFHPQDVRQYGLFPAF